VGVEAPLVYRLPTESRFLGRTNQFPVLARVIKFEPHGLWFFGLHGVSSWFSGSVITDRDLYLSRRSIAAAELNLSLFSYSNFGVFCQVADHPRKERRRYLSATTFLINDCSTHEFELWDRPEIPSVAGTAITFDCAFLVMNTTPTLFWISPSKIPERPKGLWRTYCNSAAMTTRHKGAASSSPPGPVQTIIFNRRQQAEWLKSLR
jgi:hypothetical protein